MRQYEPRYHSKRSASRARRGANDPFMGRLGLMAFLFVLLVPVAMILRTDGKRHVSTNGLPGAAAVIEPGAATTSPAAASTTTRPAPSSAVTFPVIDPATGKPVVTTAAATASAAIAVTSGAQRSKATESAAGSGSSGDSPQQRTSATTKATRTTTTEQVTAANKKRSTTTTRPRRTTTTTRPKPKRTTTTTTPKPKAAPPPAVYSQAQSEAIIRQIWPDSLEDKALAIANRESHLRNSARNWCCYGLFQIHFNANKKWLAQIGVTNANQLLDPTVNTRAALVMYMRAGWAPWGG